MSPRTPSVPPVGSIIAVWWGDPSMDPEIYDPATPDTLQICPKVTVGVLVSKNRHDLVLSHESFLDGTGRQWVRTVISRRLVDRIESIPDVVVAVPKGTPAPASVVAVRSKL